MLVRRDRAWTSQEVGCGHGGSFLMDQPKGLQVTKSLITSPLSQSDHIIPCEPPAHRLLFSASASLTFCRLRSTSASLTAAAELAAPR